VRSWGGLRGAGPIPARQRATLLRCVNLDRQSVDARQMPVIVVVPRMKAGFEKEVPFIRDPREPIPEAAPVIDAALSVKRLRQGRR
jgi:hypothetical protein